MEEKPKVNVHDFLENLADEMGKRHIQKINSQLNGEDRGLRYLKIPLIGGFMYLVSSYNRARRVVAKNKQDIVAKQNVRLVTKEHNKVRRNIERQISDILLNQQVTKISVPLEHLGDFLAVIKEMDVGVKQLTDTEFLIVSKGGVIL